MRTVVVSAPLSVVVLPSLETVASNFDVTFPACFRGEFYFRARSRHAEIRETDTVSITMSTRRKRIFFLPRFGIVAKADELYAWSRLVKNCCPFEMGYSVILPRSGGMIRAPFGSGNTSKWCGSRTSELCSLLDSSNRSVTNPNCDSMAREV